VMILIFYAHKKPPRSSSWRFNRCSLKYKIFVKISIRHPKPGQQTRADLVDRFCIGEEAYCFEYFRLN
jgi:hypothetical protein